MFGGLVGGGGDSAPAEEGFLRVESLQMHFGWCMVLGLASSPHAENSQRGISLAHPWQWADRIKTGSSRWAALLFPMSRTYWTLPTGSAFASTMFNPPALLCLSPGLRLAHH